MNLTYNPKVDEYLVNGCMRCKFGGTPMCKVLNWKEEIEFLRSLILEFGLKEEIKWSVPVYTYNHKNILLLAAFKNYTSLNFFKGSLLSDPYKILEQQGNIQASRIIKIFKKL